MGEPAVYVIEFETDGQTETIRKIFTLTSMTTTRLMTRITMKLMLRTGDDSKRS